MHGSTRNLQPERERNKDGPWPLSLSDVPERISEQLQLVGSTQDVLDGHNAVTCQENQ